MGASKSETLLAVHVESELVKMAGRGEALGKDMWY